jgi:putrescine:ornithine antiporter
MMEVAKVERSVYLRNMVITLVAMLYSTYAIWASGLQAVMGGVLVMSIGYIIWGIIAPRFTTGTTAARAPTGVAGVAVAAFTIALLAALPLPSAEAATCPAGTLDRVKQSGKLTLGYRTDAQPFSYRDESGNAAGYSVALCQKIAEQAKAELKLPNLTVEWVTVTMEGRFQALQEGKVDLLCEADTETLTRRQDVGFSIAIYPGGIGALLRSDSSWRLREILTKGKAASGPFWRASPAQILEQQTFSVVPRTTSETWLAGRLDKFQLTAKVVPVPSYEDGIKRVLDRSTNVFFGDRAILLEVAKRSSSKGDLIVLDRHFTYEPIALALQRGDEDFRLLVDRTLSRLFVSEDFRFLYAKWFGKPGEFALEFFRLSALPE